MSAGPGGGWAPTALGWRHPARGGRVHIANDHSCGLSRVNHSPEATEPSDTVRPMRAVVSFVVRAKLPDALAPLRELAFNLRWSWDAKTEALFRWVDAKAWEETGHDPVALLGVVPREQLEELAVDPTFL